jgi:hypothetical protein
MVSDPKGSSTNTAQWTSSWSLNGSEQHSSVAERQKMNFETELKQLINKYSVENGSDTPDWILAQYIMDALGAYERAVIRRDHWYSFKPWGEGVVARPDMCEPPKLK